MSATNGTEHVLQSVAAATQALDQLEQSLRSGGFAEGAAAYQRMAEVLVAQRLVHDDGAMAPGFERLGDTARKVFELLDPYSTAMRRLAALAPERADDRARQAVLDQLGRRGRRGASASVLARASRMSAESVEQSLQELVAAGIVVVRGSGEVCSYRLAEHVHPRGGGGR